MIFSCSLALTPDALLLSAKWHKSLAFTGLICETILPAPQAQNYIISIANRVYSLNDLFGEVYFSGYFRSNRLAKLILDRSYT